MRILFCQDMNPMGTGGGAQATDREFINFGIRQGHDIYILTPHEIGKTPVKDFELAILSNCVTFPKNELKKLTDNCRFMVYTHDYYICRFRLYFPSLPKCTTCRYMPFWKDIYARSKLNIFMSPLHWETHLGVIPELSKYPHAIVPSAINPKDHQAPMGVDVKPGTVVGVNNLFGFKGRENVLQYAQEHKELQFTLVGGKEKEVELPENCQYVGYKQREELAAIFATHEYLIHLPGTPQPFERSPIEFLIANPKGKLIINQLVGARSFPWFGKSAINREEIIRHCEEAPKHFWREVNACPK